MWEVKGISMKGQTLRETLNPERLWAQSIIIFFLYSNKYLGIYLKSALT